MFYYREVTGLISMHRKFDSQAIEKKWQERWKHDGLYTAGERDKSKEKEYVLVEWPYPSGNLHIGHWYAFAVPDIYVRYRRMTGKQVLYPMGFDAFGLPAENAAIKRNLDPKEWTESNIAFMRGQLESMGNAFSWDKTTSSTDSAYYKWTQWMFTKFFEKGIAYRGTGIVNWCPKDNTVLANEQVLPDGTCERCGTLVEKREMPQWLLKITDYADRLIDDLDQLDWPVAIKESQRNWIGRNYGIRYKLKVKDTALEVETYSTHYEAFMADTFAVIAADHPDLIKIIAGVADEQILLQKAKELTQKKNKEGFKVIESEGFFTGRYLEDPITGKDLPLWVSSYALADYGTGIVKCSCHDERDFAFAKKYNIPMYPVLFPENSEEKQKVQNLEYCYTDMDNGVLAEPTEFSGKKAGNLREDIASYLESTGHAKREKAYRLRDWSIGRQRYWGVPIPIVYDPEGKAHPIPEKHLPWVLPTDVDFKPTGEPPLSKSKELKERVEKIFGIGWTPDYETMDTFVDSSWYFLRYIDNQNDKSLSSKEKQNQWMSVDLYFGGAEHTTMHLLYSRFWQKALFDLGLVNDSEPYKKRLNRGLVLGPDGNKMSKSKGNVIDPDEQVSRVGADTVKMYLAFMGPYGEVTNYPWDMGGIAGIRRFLERVNGLSEHIIDQSSEAEITILNKTIKKVRSDISSYKFNTAISTLMMFINAAEKEGVSKDSYETFLRLLAPFAPHLTEELWESLGHSDSIHKEEYPSFDESLTIDREVNIGVQLNGKVRGTVKVSPEASESEVLELAKAEPGVAKYLEGQELKKVVYVPGRILNLIV